jgi:hypothetical protein
MDKRGMFKSKKEATIWAKNNVIQLERLLEVGFVC